MASPALCWVPSAEPFWLDFSRREEASSCLLDEEVGEGTCLAAEVRWREGPLSAPALPSALSAAQLPLLLGALLAGTPPLLALRVCSLCFTP